MTNAPPKQPVRPAPPPPPMAMRTPPPVAPPHTLNEPKARVVTTRDKPPLVPKIVHYAGEKFGKTSTFAHAPSPIVFMAGETGYNTLLSAGRVPAVPAEHITTWFDQIDWVNSLIRDPQGIKTLIIDGIGALDRMCQELVCERDYKGDWNDAKEGFYSWGANKAHTIVASEWAQLLSKLEQLRQKWGVVPVLLGHATTANTPNPTGPDYQTYTCDSAKKTWAEIARWSDCILFGRFYSVVVESKAQASKNIAERKGKGIGGADRVLYTEGRDAFVAGNRYGMMPSFTMPDDPAQTWPCIWGEITRDKSVPIAE